MDQNQNANEGSLKISEEVIATIAGIATGEIKGVAGLSLRPNSEPNIKGFIRSRKNIGKAIRLEIKEGEAVIDIFVNLYLGVRIPDVASEIQAKVKDAVQNMTGITVAKINVHVSGVILDKEAVQE